MNEQMKRRSNPFDKPINDEATKFSVDETQENEKLVEQVAEPVYNEPVQPYQYQQQPVKQVRRQQKNQYIQPKNQYIQQMDQPKDKYTATMDTILRRNIKIYCAQNGMMFSEFVEEACREKLAREGIK